MVGEPVRERSREEDVAGMWCDLLLANNAAVAARFRVTQRAQLYMRVAGLPLEPVLDALGTDRAGWQARLGAWEAERTRNLAAARHQGPVS